MASANKLLHTFARHIAACPEGTPHQIGIMWDPENGWRAYQRIGEKGLAMGPAEARSIARRARARARDPKWRGAWATLGPMFDELEKIAGECEAKNAAGAVPEGAVEYMEPRGSA